MIVSVRLASLRKVIVAVVSAIVLAGLFAGVQATRLVHTLDEVTLDLQFLLRGERSTDSLPITIVGIDDAATAPYGQKLPVPRDLVARLVSELGAAGARCIGLNLDLSTPQPEEAEAALVRALAAAPMPEWAPVMTQVVPW